jgi:alginate O-acetyltransferase complex protein AlgI
MLFSSPVFLFLFLPAVLALYFAVRRGFRNALLLFASLFFYAWGEQEIVAIMVLSIFANYGFGIWVDRVRERPTVRCTICWAMSR